VTEFTISRAKEILGRAHGGCVFCNAIAEALTALYPRWRKGKGYLDVFLASGLPIVVRWTAGITKVLSGVGECGTDLVLTATTIDTAPLQRSANNLGRPRTSERKPEDIVNPSFELELYRPRIPLEHLTLGSASSRRCIDGQ